jgi:hypothetical protein
MTALPAIGSISAAQKKSACPKPSFGQAEDRLNSLLVS